MTTETVRTDRVRKDKKTREKTVVFESGASD